MILKNLLILILSLAFWLTTQQTATALACQKTFHLDTSAQPICLMQIKRSAKNYWEYRVNFKIGDRPKITRIYDCRSHSFWQSGLGRVTEHNQLEKYICRLYRKP